MNEAAPQSALVLVGLLMQRARKELGWTQQRLAERLGVAQKEVSLWERGKRGMNVDELLRIAQALGVDPITLLPEDEPRALPVAATPAPPRLPWTGYGPAADARQWQLAAEWMWCQGRHGDAIDNIVGKNADTDTRLAAFHVYEEAADMLANAAQRLARGHTHEACCPEKQRMNRGMPLQMEQSRAPR